MEKPGESSTFEELLVDARRSIEAYDSLFGRKVAGGTHFESSRRMFLMCRSLRVEFINISISNDRTDSEHLAGMLKIFEDVLDRMDEELFPADRASIRDYIADVLTLDPTADEVE